MVGHPYQIMSVDSKINRHIGKDKLLLDSATQMADKSYPSNHPLKLHSAFPAKRCLALHLLQSKAAEIDQFDHG